MGQPEQVILVVDDDEEYLNYVSAALSSTGWKVVVAASAIAAVQAVRRERFSLILTDLRLAHHSGLEVLAEARKQDPLTVVVVMTAFGTVESALQALGQGAYDYLLKPCPADVLQASVRRGLEHHELRRSLVDRTAEIERLKRDYSHTSRMIRDISARLRTPVDLARGTTALLARQEQGPSMEELRRGLQTIYDSTVQMQALIADLLRAAEEEAKK